MPSSLPWRVSSHHHVMIIRSDVTVLGSRTGCASGGSWSVSPPAPHGSTSKRSSSTGCRTRRCAHGATSGSTRACSTSSKPRPRLPTTGSSASTSLRSASTVLSTSRPTAAREQAQTPLIVGSWGGSGLSRRSVAASPSGGRSTARTATTSVSSNRPSTPVAANGLLVDIDTLHLDRGYDYPVVRERLRALGLDDLSIQRRGTKVPGKKQPVRLGLRWIVEATNSWWSNYGQLRRNTDRRSRHRHAALCLATTVLIAGRLIDYRDRWSPA